MQKVTKTEDGGRKGIGKSGNQGAGYQDIMESGGEDYAEASRRQETEVRSQKTEVRRQMTEEGIMDNINPKF